MNSNFRFLHWSHKPECASSMDKRFAGYHSLQLSTRGKISLSYDQETRHLGGTFFWFHYPGPRIRLSPLSATWHHRHAAFQGKLCDAWVHSGLLAVAPVDCPLPRRSEFIAQFDRMLAWLEQGNTASMAKARAGLELLLWELWEIRRHPTTHHAIADAVAEFAIAHQFHVGSYERLAAELGLSMSSLRRRVLEASGVPLHQFVRALRLREARRLLRNTYLSLAEIADELGFADPYYFNREFSRLAGITPGAYRQSIF